MEPAVRECVAGRLRFSPIPFAQLRRAIEDLAELAWSEIIARVIDDTGLDEEHRAACRAGMVVVLLRSEDRAQRTELRLSEAVVEPELGKSTAQLPEHRPGHDGGAVVGLAQVREVPSLEVRAVRQGHPHRGSGEERIDPSRLEDLQ